jgi:D-sedoheptulose 7-phosphate isomerase
MTAAQNLIELRLQESIELTSAVLRDQTLLAGAARAAELIGNALREDRRVLLFGNGGSAADATHLAAELVGRFKAERPAMAALSLTDNASSLSAIANDYAYELVFARQVEAFGSAGDVAVALSTSGTSPNVVAGLRAAASRGMRTLAFTGASGGDLLDAAELCVRIPSAETAHVQECTMVLCHAICEWVERDLLER